MNRLFLSVLTILACSALLLSGVSCSGRGTDDDNGDDIDNIPPAKVTDLRVSSVTRVSAVLNWTVPGDDGMQGIAVEYDLRGSDQLITEANFLSCYRVDDIWGPPPAGVTDRYQLDGLTPGMEYFFALRVRDDADNWSEMSNCISFTCLPDQIVIFTDPVLEQRIRARIHVPTGDILASQLEEIVDFGAEDAGITDLTGLEHCINLTMLGLQNNQVSDLSPLSNLSSLRGLNVINNNITSIAPLSGLVDLVQLNIGENPISDLSPAAGFTNLEVLTINYTQIRDFSALGSLTKLKTLRLNGLQIDNIQMLSPHTGLEELHLTANQLEDLSPLAGLSQLKYLFADANRIADLQPLQGLANLSVLTLSFNRIVDIQPLVANSGLAQGDEINLRNNPLSENARNVQIPALQARGVTVHY